MTHPSYGRTEQISLPLDAYLPSPSEEESEARAEVLLIDQCMKKFGVPWQPPTAKRLRRDRTIGEALEAGRFGLVDEEQARKYGYHAPPGHPLADPPKKEKSSKPPPNQMKVMYGTAATFNGTKVPAGGCSGYATRQIFTVRVPASKGNVSSTIKGDAIARADSDPKMHHVVNTWIACMGKAGYHYTSMGAASKSWPQTGEPSKKEIAMAVTDVRCSKKAGYLTTRVDLLSKYQRQLIKKNGEVMRLAKKRKTEARRNAAKVLGES